VAEVKPVKDVTPSKPVMEEEVEEKPEGHPLLNLVGVGAIVIGGVMTVLPAVMPGQAQLVNSLAKHGVTGLPIALAGLVLCALVVVTRKKPDTSHLKHYEDQALVLEQLASDLALTRGGMQDLRVEFVYLKDEVQTAAAKRDLADSKPANDDAQSALFRLAGSMDQLTGRLETRMIGLDNGVSDQFGQVRGEIAEIKNHVGELRARIEEGVQAAASAEHNTHKYHHSDERQIEVDQGYDAHDDDLHVSVSLDDDEVHNLGLLDEFDEYGHHRAEKQSPSNRPARRSSDLDSQAGLLPSRNGRRKLDVDEKIAVLRELMADPSVRQALDAARRHS